MTSQDSSRRQIAAAPSLSARSLRRADSSVSASAARGRPRRRFQGSLTLSTLESARRPIQASRRLCAPAHVVLQFLADLENHALLAPASVSVLSLDGQRHRATRALVRLRGPLAIRRTASTELLRATGSSIVGRANVGNTTVASVVWKVEALGEGSVVTLCATVDAASSLDGLLLRFGGRRWLAGRFAGALEQLSQQLTAAASATTRSSQRGLRVA